ncbi:hypothetical protein EB796_006548 [Bugula neritina]|uniref:Uncharacterized protein n=1 Tax=Bugula neritina TaxID=10212 RepID=A0A7J7KAA9_BUGNE|nr:hypothetical protein EB796_006548 [Bugula neritina]
MAMGVSWATMTLLLMVATFPQLTQADLVLPSIAYNGAEKFATKNTSAHKALVSCSNPSPCISSTHPSIETLVSAGFASGVFIAILLTAITCYFYWKKKSKSCSITKLLL